MKKRNLYYGLLMATTVFLSCKKDNDRTPLGTGKDLVLTAEEQLQVTADNKFNFKLFKQLAANTEEDKNLIFSPLSITMVLSMTSNGAQGASLDEMRQVLEQKGFSEDQINSYYKKLNSELPILDPLADLKVANSIWYRKEFTPISAFITTNKEHYNAAVEALDFNNPAAKDIINNWVSKNTNGKIPTIINGIGGDIIMYLVNAVYFKSDWKYPFDKKKTQKQTFYTSSTKTVQTDFMQGTVSLKMGAFAGLTVVELPYGNDKYSMLVVLPNAGKSIKDVVNNTDAATWESWMKGLNTATVELQFPKFKFAHRTVLNGPLNALGIVHPFTDDADFSRIDPKRGIKISEVIHKAFIEVNEAGTEAAAATSVGMAVTSAGPPGTAILTIDRPFIFVIREMKNGLILFNGVVSNPLLAE